MPMPRPDSANLQLPLPPPPLVRLGSDGKAPRAPLRVAGLFAGVGGLELGLRGAGHETRLLCEIDPGARAVLSHWMPGISLHDDVRTLRSLPPEIELVSAGFPCQDLSQAGKTVGIEGSRSGLVGEVFRLLRQQRVPWVMLENVPFMLHLSRGRAMEVIIDTLSSLGYRWAYRVVNSRAFGVPQRRKRVIFLASLDDDPRDVLFADEAGEPETTDLALGRLACGFYWTEGNRGLGWAVDAVPTLKGGSSVGIPSPPAIVLPDGNVVKPNLCDAERMQGFVPDWTAPAEKVARAGYRWKLVGNAVTVDVARWVGERLRSPSAAGRDVEGHRMHREDAWPQAAWDVGDGIHVANLSAFPMQLECAHLHEWLQFPTKRLSVRATSGFLARICASSLRFPEWFPKTLRAHLRSVEREDKALLKRVEMASRKKSSTATAAS